MKPNRLLPILLFAIYSFAQTTEVASFDYQQLQPLLHQNSESVQVVNFWATWCAPCIKELPYFEELNKLEGVEVLLVSLDFPKHKQKRLIPFVEKQKLQSKVVHLDDENENYWINEISTTWSGALPATLIYSQNRRGFYEQSFTKSELFKEVKSYF
ncbi:MAG: thioredoxin [Flavobacteriaceae bacterium]|nr:thioredoxin [Flavobacteriaceae bacterium]|tara:strand:- start:423 stop:890 length:468 start_codon:yes stop_codon:yes gene_type:complete